MSFINLVNKRFSVRRYQDRSIEKIKMLLVLEAGRLAPSAVNKQPWYFVVIQDKQKLAEIRKTYRREWLAQAPAIIVICGDHSQSWRRPGGKDHCDIDVAIAVDHMTLAAAELGLGTCWVCMFDAMQCHRIMKLPENIEPVVLLPIGYPDEVSTERHIKRKAIEEIVRWDEF